MIRAASLIYAISIALILAILSSSLILLAFNSRTMVQNNLIEEKQIINLNSGLNYYLTNPDLWTTANSKISVDLFQHGNDSVDIEKKKWGLWDIIICTAHNRHNLAAGAFLAGDKSKNDSLALYLADQNKPLALCGNTLITGNAYLPSAGVKRAFIEGQNYSNTQLIYGNALISNSNLPDFNPYIPQNFSALISARPGDSLVDIQILQNNKALSNSFNNRTLILSVTGDVNLDNYNLDGNIIIRSSGTIHISTGCWLKNVLLEAQSIIIEDGFSGSIQGFATNSISVGNHTILKYPSCLCLIPEKKPTRSGTISLQRNCVVKGAVINFCIPDILSKSANVEIAEGCTITGMVYSRGYVSHQGNITGSLYCTGFILKTPSAIYEDHLLNCTINANTLSPYFVGIYPTIEIKRKAVIERLE